MELYKLNGKTYPCSTTVTMDYIGGKWKTVILWYLAISPHRYSQLRKNLVMMSKIVGNLYNFFFFYKSSLT